MRTRTIDTGALTPSPERALKSLSDFRDGFCYDHVAYGDYLRGELKPGDGVTVCLWSDRHAYTIIKRTKNTLTIRECIAVLSPDFTPEWIPGGFAGHCTNQDEQEYAYYENPNGQVITAYWSPKRHAFYVYQGEARVIAGRREFYDYNF